MDRFDNTNLRLFAHVMEAHTQLVMTYVSYIETATKLSALNYDDQTNPKTARDFEVTKAELDAIHEHLRIWVERYARYYSEYRRLTISQELYLKEVIMKAMYSPLDVNTVKLDDSTMNQLMKGVNK